MNGMFAIITSISAALAATMTLIALRMVWKERQRSEARVAALAADIHASSGTSPDQQVDDEVSPVAMAQMFTPSQGTPRRWILGPGAIGLAAAAAILLMIGLSSGGPGSPGSEPSAPQQRSAAETSQPLELIALDHEREDDHLTVRGIVRNPVHSTEVDHLTAVVLLFNRQGSFLTSGRAAVTAPALGAGAEAAFAITVPGAADVGRYRVSFRTDDQVVPHVDRRHSQG